MKSAILLLLAAFALAGAAPAGGEPAKQVTAAMEALRQAMLHRDRDALHRLTSDDLTYTHSGGQHETKAQFVESIASGKSVIDKLEFTHPTIRIYSNTALFISRVDLWHSPTDVVPMDILHVWVKAPAGWKLVARQATRLPK